MDLAAVLAVDFEATLASLDRLSREHQLLFQLEVGRAILADFFGGDPALYLSRDPTKPSRFTEFVTSCAPQLTDLGLAEGGLRRCVIMRIVYESLPQEITGNLRFGHYVELGKVTDTATRRLLASASVDNGWSAAQLRDAVLAARAGRWIDGQPDIPGIQPPIPQPEPTSAPQLGRVVTRFERAASDFDALVGEWAAVAAKKTTTAQRKRMAAALGALEARVSTLRKSLDSTPD